MAKFVNEFGLDVSPFLKGIAKAKDKADDLEKLDPSITVDVDSSEVDKAKTEINQLDGKVVNVKVDADTKGAEKGLGAFGAIAGGLVGGAAIQGISALTGKITEGALAGDDLADSLEVAFSQAGIADVEGAIKRTTEANLELANSLGQDVARVDELSIAAAGLAGVAGQVNKDMTKAAIGIEQLSGGAVKGEAVIKALSRGLADPEGAAAIESLAKKYPQLAETLRGTGDAASKLAAINKELGPTFETLESQASGPDAVLQKLQNTLARAFQGAGDALFKALAPVADTLNEVLTPLLESLGPAIGGIVASLAPLLQSLAQQLAPVLTTLGSNLAPIIASLVKGLVPLVEGVLPVFVSLLEGVGPVVATIAEVVGTFVAELAKGLQPAFKAIADVLPKVLDGLQPLLKTLGGNLGSLVGKLAEAIGNLLAAILPLVPVLVDALVPILQLLIEVGITPLRAGITLLTGAIDLIAKAVNGVVGFFKSLFATIVDGAKNVPILGDALAFLPKIIESVKQAFNSLVQSLPDFVKEILGIQTASEDVNKAVEGTSEAIADQTSTVQANTKAVATNTKTKTAGTKAAETALQKATKEYQKQNAALQQQAKIEKDRIEVLRLQGVLTDEIAKSKIKTIDAQVSAKQLALAKKIFDAEVDDLGFFISTKIKPSKDESLDELDNLFADLAKKNYVVPFTVKADATDAKLLAGEIEGFLDDLQPPSLIDEDALLASAEKVTDGINAEFGSIAFNKQLEDELANLDISSIVSDIFSKGGAAQEEELNKQAKQLEDNLKSNRITYQEYVQEIGLLQEELGDRSSALDNIFASAGAGLSAGLGAAIANMKTSYDDLAKRIEDGSATISDSLKLVGTEAGLQFAKLVAEGENVGTALLKAVGASAQKLLALYTPEILALFAATIPPPFGLIAGTAAVASLNALLQASLSGFEEGGFTGGREGEVRGVVHGAEYVANAKLTKREKGLFKFLDAGGTSEQYFAMMQKQDKQKTFIADNGMGAMVNVLTNISDRLARIPNESFMKQSMDVQLALDGPLYAKQMHKARVRRLR